MQTAANFTGPDEIQPAPAAPRTLSITLRRPGEIAARIHEMIDAGESLAGIAIESGVALDGLATWLSGEPGKYKGEPGYDETVWLSHWLNEVDADIAKRTGDFVLTPGARRYLRAFEHARAERDSEGRRGVAMIFGSSGTGKTEAARYAARMDHNVVYVLVDGESRTWTRLLGEVANAAGSYGGPNTGETFRELVLRKVSRGGLLIFDHAHMLRQSLMEQLLSFPEEHSIGLAFIGNLSAHTALTSKKVVQLTSRASGATVIVGMPDADEVDAHLEALGIAGRKEREFCQLIGRQDGGLRFLYATVRKARQIAGSPSAAPGERLLQVAAAKVGCWSAS